MILHCTMLFQLICVGLVLIQTEFVFADVGGIPHWMNSGKIPPEHQHNIHSGPKPDLSNSGKIPPGHQHNIHSGSKPDLVNSGKIPPGHQYNAHSGSKPDLVHNGKIPPGHQHNILSGHKPDLVNSGKIPPGHQHNIHSGPKPDLVNTPHIEIPKELPHRRYHDYRAWWKAFQSDLQECGKQQIPPRNPLLRVIGGHVTTVDSYPWMVSMYSTLIKQPWCGGTLISPQWIVTAAHCFRPPFNKPATWTIHMGKNNASGFAEYVDEQVRSISELKIHPDFNFSKNNYKFDNDIALIKLDKAVVFSRHTSPLCLVQNFDDVMTHLLKPETRCTITGYGISDLVNTRREQNALHVADVPLINKETCLHVNDYKNQVSDNMICAGLETGGVDTCLGDSGGPLQCQINDIWYQVGITSWGPVRCAEPRKPGVYTDLSKYTDWIHTQIFNDYTRALIHVNGFHGQQ